MIYGEMNHAIHPEHVLKLEQKGPPYTCNGCGQLGLGHRYTCKEHCNIHLHEDCADPRPDKGHDFFPKCRFKFINSSEAYRRCDACGEDIKFEGYSYHCSCKRCEKYMGYDLHPCCAYLKMKIEAGNMVFKLNKKTSAKCYNCGKKELEPGVKSWSYVSTDNTCHIHVSCVMKMFLESWKSNFLGRGGEDLDMALEEYQPRLQIVLRDDVKRTPKFAKLKTIMKIVITVIIATIVGDPTSMVVGLISGLITR